MPLTGKRTLVHQPQSVLHKELMLWLRKYYNEFNCSKLMDWYARFLETQGQENVAKEYYEKAGNLQSIVRIMSDEVDEALQLVRTTKNRSAAFQLAHTLEVDETVGAAVLVELYEIASAYSSALRICMV